MATLQASLRHHRGEALRCGLVMRRTATLARIVWMAGDFYGGVCEYEAGCAAAQLRERGTQRAILRRANATGKTRYWRSAAGIHSVAEYEIPRKICSRATRSFFSLMAWSKAFDESGAEFGKMRG